MTCIFPARFFFHLVQIAPASAAGTAASLHRRRQSTSALIYSLRGSLGFAYFATPASKLILDSGANKFLPTANEMRRVTLKRESERERQREHEPGGGHLRDYPKKTFTGVPRIRRYPGLNNLQN